MGTLLQWVGWPILGTMVPANLPSFIIHSSLLSSLVIESPVCLRSQRLHRHKPPMRSRHRCLTDARGVPACCADAQARVAQVTKDLGEVKADRQAKEREVGETAAELARASEAAHRLKVKLNDRKQAASVLAAALASELGLTPDVQSALEAQDTNLMPAALAKLGSMVGACTCFHAIHACTHACTCLHMPAALANLHDGCVTLPCRCLAFGQGFLWRSLQIS